MSFIRQNFHSRIVEFRHLWLSVEHFIGNAHLPLFAEAQELNEFIFDLDSQSNPLHEVLRESYRRAKCSTLNSSIDPFIVMDVLGESLFNQKNRDDVDVVLVDLIERIGLHISRKFISCNTSHNNEKITKQSPLSLSGKKSVKTNKTTQTNIATVFSFEKFKNK